MTMTKRLRREREVTIVLHKLGVNVDLEGYRKIYNILLAELEEEPDRCLRNEAVEKEIQEVLENLMKRHSSNPKSFFALMFRETLEQGRTPTNSEFIASILDYLRI